ncbi:transglycosylase SLT domain-containing protein [Desulfovibrio sp. OttesenSCG-928-O18]|nr:transglycosylase SLT domain-containing protein [Desulfovibrio sp. OttesenSCG-928-O18]
MTAVAPDIAPKRKKRIPQRFRRVVAVLGLCVVVLPVTGFWVDVNDAGRGISAVRMRIDFSATAPALPQNAAVFAARETMPLSTDPGRYRATLRDVPRPVTMDENALVETSGGRSLISLYNNQVALALADETYLPLRRISRKRPSQVYRFWAESATFLPADGLHRNADPTNTRWLTDANWKMGGTCESRVETGLAEDMQRLLIRMRAPLSAKPHPKSAQYMELIDHSSRRFGLAPQLVYAIMRTESAFNPFAVSNAGALGLMQVVPDSAGNEVRAYLTGKKSEKPTSSFLFDPESNIEYGCAYLHLLATRYFSGVRNQASRELCMIAGYNAGPRAVLKVFSANTEDAVAAINALTPEELFQKLSRQMPAEETRLYIGKVLSSISSYPG